MATTRRARRIQRELARSYPYAVAELDFDDAWQLLVATVLSAQTTDVRVNSVTPGLFAAYPGPRELAEAPAEDVEEPRCHDLRSSLGGCAVCRSS